MTGPTCWLIRAGERSRHAPRFLDGGVVAIGWPNVEGLGDLRRMSADEMLLCLERHRSIGRPSQDARELLTFRDAIQRGDVVVTPDSRRREVLIGRIRGGYEFRDPSPTDDYRHVRDVEWLDQLPRDLLEGHLAKELNYQRSIRRLAHQDEWIRLAEAAEAAEDPG